MGKIEFITRIQVNGVKEEVSGAKASEIIRERVENALQAMNYEKRAARVRAAGRDKHEKDMNYKIL